MSVILSNRRWFTVYVWLRNAVIFLTFLCLFAVFLSAAPPAWLLALRAICFPLFLLLIIYDLLQKPGFVEVVQEAAASLSVALYLPDTRTFFYFDQRRVRRFAVRPEDRLELLAELKALPWRQKLQLVVTRPDGGQFRSPVLDVSWARKEDIRRLYEVAKTFPRSEVGGGKSELPSSAE